MSFDFKTVTSLSSDEKKSDFDIWNDVYPRSIAYKTPEDFEDYLLRCRDSTHILGRDGEQVVAWSCLFSRDHGRWFALVVDSRFQRQGIGGRMLAKMKELESEIGGWITLHDHYLKSDGSAYNSPKKFYENHGFVITDQAFKTESLSTVKIIWEK